MDCFVRVYNEQGIATFWKSNLINCFRYFPTQALNFAHRNHFRNLWPVNGRDTHFSAFVKNVFSGAVAGCVSLAYVRLYYIIILIIGISNRLYYDQSCSGSFM